PTDNIEAYFNALKNEELFDALEENGEPIAFFEYTDLEKENILPVLPDYIQSSAMQNAAGGIYDIRFDGLWKFICAGNERWVKLVTDRQKEQLTKIGAQGIYNDVGICSTHPVFCYDDSHTHGTRINTLPEFYNLLETSWKVSRSVKVNAAGDNGFTGQEMITEQVIPWVDFYQTRAGAGEMGCMENSAIMNLVKGDVAYKIPLFEYVYHEYAGVRGDGFIIPVDSVGVPYYATVASIALNGGIPEYNYECYNNHVYTGLEKLLNEDMIGFVDTLGEARLSYGKNYLVYGAMARVPSLNLARERYTYETPLVNNWTAVGGSKKGSMYVDPVVSSAFTFGGKTAIFLCNITANKKSVEFTLNAGSLYGVE
ncbi:MAG: hypothetical protein K2L87_03605, partial [Clostridiales bacterium]|nr:hypothetical protein [Clostridiales bacterium]